MSENNEEDHELSFLEHLVELRSRLLKACLSIVVVLIALLPFSRSLYETLASPMMAQLPAGSSMIAIDVASPFLTPFKLTLLVSIMISIPVVLVSTVGLCCTGIVQARKKTGPALVAVVGISFLCRLRICILCRFSTGIRFPDTRGT